LLNQSAAQSICTVRARNRIACVGESGARSWGIAIVCVYESSSDDCPEPGFIADELAVLQRYLAPEKLPPAAKRLPIGQYH